MANTVIRIKETTLSPFTVEIQEDDKIIASVVCSTLQDAFKCIESEGLAIFCSFGINFN